MNGMKLPLFPILVGSLFGAYLGNRLSSTLTGSPLQDFIPLFIILLFLLFGLLKPSSFSVLFGVALGVGVAFIVNTLGGSDIQSLFLSFVAAVGMMILLQIIFKIAEDRFGVHPGETTAEMFRTIDRIKTLIGILLVLLMIIAFFFIGYAYK